MSIRLEMLQVARLAPKMLGEVSDLVGDFFAKHQAEDGGFTGRTGQSDLYYTVFGMDGLIALERTPDYERLAKYVAGFGDGEGLDFVHLCCLARCWSELEKQGAGSDYDHDSLLSRINAYRSKDHGFNARKDSESGTAYGAFLAVGAHQDLGGAVKQEMRLVQSLKLLEREDGGWANEPSMGMSSTNSTAAAVTVLRNLNMPLNPGTISEYLFSQIHEQGGFLAAPMAPMPDLLSTATTLHALSGLQIDLRKPAKEACLDFIDTLWTNEGAFHGNWSDEYLDVEYTSYGLLALGHLAV